ncbi:hypothetical protein BH23CHL6_BH23CHL6_11870 [soil metagenome]
MKSWKSVATLSLVMAFGAAACGGGTPAGDGNGLGNGTDGPAADPAASPMRTVIVDQDSEAQAYPLQGGRYRLAWRSTDCPDGVEMVVTKVDNLQANPNPSAYEYRRATSIPAFNTLMQNVPPGIYTFEQAIESCETWQLRADRVGT